MSVGRRGFLGLLAAAPVAAPAAVGDVMAGISPPIGAFDGYANKLSYAGRIAECGSNKIDASFWRERLKELSSKRGERRASYRRRVSKLDPDLASSRSLSLNAKIRIQAERDEQIDFEEESGRFLRLAAEAVGL